MMISLWIAFVLVCLVLTFIRIPLWSWLIVGVVGGGLFHYFSHPISASVLFIITGIVAVIFAIRPIRRHVITAQFIDLCRRLLPPISTTEQAALMAGDTTWEADLFRGLPKWSTLQQSPYVKLSAEEEAFINNQVEELCRMLDAWDIKEKNDLPQNVWEYIKKERFWGMIVPKAFGGLEFSSFAHSCIVMKLASKSVTAAVTVMVPNSLGPAELLLRYGTKEQKEYYLPRLADGSEIPCFGLTALQAGSDAAAMVDKGIICRGEHNGQTVIGIRLTWEKRYITLAPVATVVGLAFKLYDPEHLLSEQVSRGITLCLLPATHPGVHIGERHLPIGSSFMNGPTHGKDVFVPLDWIIGGPDYIGRGWQMLMECLAAGRAISLPALSTADAKLAYRITGAYALVRQQFNIAISQFEGVQESLAQIAGNAYLCEALRLMTIASIDAGHHPSVASAITKYHTTEMARCIINHAMDIHGGRGIMQGPRNYLSEAYQTMPVAITVEGANILTRNLIIFGQGAVRCHPYLLAEMQALANPDKKQSLNDFDKAFFSHVGYAITNKVRAITLGITCGWYCPSQLKLPEQTRYYYRQLSHLSCALAYINEVIFIFLGGELKRRERLSARLGDILSYLFMASAVLKYYEQNGQSADELPLVKWSLNTLLHKIGQAFEGVFNNMPHSCIGKILRCAVFPWGLHYELPNDKLDHVLAQQMSKTSEVRDRITNYIYWGGENEPAGRVESAFIKVLAASDIYRKLHEATKNHLIKRTEDKEELYHAALSANIITSEEMQLLREAENARYEALKVDAFTN